MSTEMAIRNEHMSTCSY